KLQAVPIGSTHTNSELFATLSCTWFPIARLTGLTSLTSVWLPGSSLRDVSSWQSSNGERMSPSSCAVTAAELVYKTCNVLPYDGASLFQIKPLDWEKRWKPS